MPKPLLQLALDTFDLPPALAPLQQAAPTKLLRALGGKRVENPFKRVVRFDKLTTDVEQVE